MASVINGSIISHSDQLCTHLSNGKNVEIKWNGEWKVIEGSVNKERYNKIGTMFVTALKYQEKERVEFDPLKKQSNGHKIKAYRAVADVILPLLEKKDLKTELQRQLIALKYRFGAKNGGLKKVKIDDNSACELFQKLKCEAISWKHHHKMYTEREKPLTNWDEHKLKLACRYTTFARLLENKENASLRKEFFSWALRDNGDVNAFVLFPCLQKKINQNFLSRRFGRFGNKVFKVGKFDENGIKVRDARILFPEAKTTWVSAIRGKNQVNLKNVEYNPSIKEVFNNFGSKNDHFGHFEVFESGVRNWNVNELGHWDPNKSRLSPNQFIQFMQRIKAFILRRPTKGGYVRKVDLSKPDLFGQLPVFETISLEKANQRLAHQLDKDGKPLNIDGTKWLISFRASRQERNLDVSGCHGFFDVMIPTEDKKHYKVYPIGKFADKFPPEWSYIFFIGDTVPAKFAFPDENVFLPRQQARHTKILDNNGVEKLVERVRYLFEKAASGNAVFQLGNENCAYEPNALHQHLFPTEPSLYTARLKDATPSQPLLSKMWQGLRSVPKLLDPIMNFLIWVLFVTFRGTFVRERDANGVMRLRWKTSFGAKQIFLPPKLHEKIEDRILTGKVWYGNPKEETAVEEEAIEA